MRVWKWIGVAGLVGVAAAGVAAGTVTIQRRRREFVDHAPDELQARLQTRLREARARQAD